ncbi:DUF4185 domain-containing protein [Novosphingobium sp. AAP1]|uniref:DUF4185 domain-containing protein n=1 Tax=Novosphingobium sp. AAP1 TaxID=1523413 RepID=UPI000A788CC6|nr:DUF4185 domain-containing protein [Novosphingobium sp. AAP1]
MSARRSFIKQVLAAAVTAGQAMWAGGALSQGPNSGEGRISGLNLRDATIFRLPGMGDGYKMTWGADGQQFIVQNDGIGFTTKPRRFYKRSLWKLDGHPPALTVDEVPGYPAVDHVAGPEDVPHYHGHGLLAVHGRIYQSLGALDRAQGRLRHWNAAKLIYSDDGGRIWRNQDGSTPVRDENWAEQSRSRLAFYDEPDGCFSLLSFLQMGQDYRANRDGYIYVYSPNGNTEGLMNQLMMFRVPIAQMLERTAYEFYAGRTAEGAPVWRPEIEARQPVHIFPEGWVNRTSLFEGDIVVETWLPSVVWNEPLGVYMMVSAGTGCASDGTEFAQPGYLGFWVSDTPWGPWRRVHEDRAWAPGGNTDGRPYSPQIAPQWLAPDGKSLWLVWADLQGIRSLSDPAPIGSSAQEPDLEPQGPLAEAEMMRQAMPLLRFNAERIDLIFSTCRMQSEQECIAAK